MSIIIHENRNIYVRLLKGLVICFPIKYQMEIKHVSVRSKYGSLEMKLGTLS